MGRKAKREYTSQENDDDAGGELVDLLSVSSDDDYNTLQELEEIEEDVETLLEDKIYNIISSYSSYDPYFKYLFVSDIFYPCEYNFKIKNKDSQISSLAQEIYNEFQNFKKMNIGDDDELQRICNTSYEDIYLRIGTNILKFFTKY